MWLFTALAACSSPAAQPSPGDACESIADCEAADDLVCNEGRCGKIVCDIPEDCPSDATCIDGFCNAKQCVGAEQCAAPGAICWKGLCLEDACLTRQDCPAGQVCLGEPPACVEAPARCETDRECPVGESCVLPDGECAPTCVGADACSGRRYCLDGLCRLPCRGDDDCTAERACVDQRCVELPDCSSEEPCAGLRPYRDPLSCDCQMCLANSDCDVSRQEVCTSSGRCVYCAEPGNSEQDCASRGRVFVDGCCTECLADDDCRGEDPPYCDRGRCVSAEPPECIAQSDCAGEQICDRGRCVEPPSFDRCQTQSDCPDGEACYADGLCRAESSVCGECPGASRCVAEPGDQLGTCAGCRQHCAAQDCPEGQRCFVDDGAADGYCIDASISTCN